MIARYSREVMNGPQDADLPHQRQTQGKADTDGERVPVARNKSCSRSSVLNGA